MTRLSFALHLRRPRDRSLSFWQGEAVEGEEAPAAEGEEAADASMPDGTPLTTAYSFHEVFTAYRARFENHLDALEAQMRSCCFRLTRCDAEVERRCLNVSLS